tara:strand:+ start:7769 stop:8026 length:258 start_codon:yes stop_codon:yes gene_type:complete
MSDTRQYLDEVKAKMGEGSRAKSWVLPKQGAFVMGCGNCGNRDFTVHVKPFDTTAQIDELVCPKCLKHLRVTGEGVIDAQGKLSL